jgi:hypothetical protein
MALCGIGRTLPGLCFGKLGEASVADVWMNHPKLEQLRSELDGPYRGICGQCIHANRCLSYCVALNYQQNGHLVTPYWLCAKAHEEGFFPASRLREGP